MCCAPRRAGRGFRERVGRRPRSDAIETWCLQYSSRGGEMPERCSTRRLADQAPRALAQQIPIQRTVPSLALLATLYEAGLDERLPLVRVEHQTDSEPLRKLGPAHLAPLGQKLNDPEPVRVRVRREDSGPPPDADLSSYVPIIPSTHGRLILKQLLDSRDTWICALRDDEREVCVDIGIIGAGNIGATAASSSRGRGTGSPSATRGGRRRCGISWRR